MTWVFLTLKGEWHIGRGGHRGGQAGTENVTKFCVSKKRCLFLLMKTVFAKLDNRLG